jgi:hypothetical protein
MMCTIGEQDMKPGGEIAQSTEAWSAKPAYDRSFNVRERCIDVIVKARR